MEGSRARCVSSASVATGPERNAALNIWKVTPAEAMLTPRSSRTSPAARLAAMTRNDSRRFTATFSKFTTSDYRGSFGDQGNLSDAAVHVETDLHAGLIV